MGAKVNGAGGVDQMLQELGKVAPERIVQQLYAEAFQLRDLARKFAPVDIGDLEQAIKVRPEQLDVHNRQGRAARQEIEVYVDADMPVPEQPGKTMGDFAYELHEDLYPYGPQNLGEKSLQKQASQTEVVGGGYLERAAEEIEARLDDVLRDILRNL